MTERLGIISTTAKQYASQAADLTVRRHLLLALCEKKDRMMFNCSGYDFNFDVKYDQAPVDTFGSGQHPTFAFRDNYKQLTAGVRGYITSDELHNKDYLMNGGETALVKHYDKKVPNLIESISDKLASSELYNDGGTGDQNRWEGLNTFLGDDGATAAGDIIARPSDSYLGQSTAPGVDSSVWDDTLTIQPNAIISTDWPWGKGDTAFDWNSPILANYSSTGWGTGSTSWQVNCDRVLQYTTGFLKRLRGNSGKLSLYNLDSKLLNEYKNFQKAKFRDIMPHPEARDLGFPDVLNQDGVMIQDDFGCPANEGYGVNVDQMMFRVLTSDLIYTEGPAWDTKTQSFLFLAGTFSNPTWLPCFFAKIKSYA